ncbi:uncharacterized protein PHALS_14649 [Plasmopara halstedii]|uniref:Uncharacterized protein n=1 Tax=Plasmopara halstedii TaxID=4781 RepID=A0A0P1ANR3_PLAHL|nr:uncharacterized protein PHALS_14649 [Plasmopara halstedii]CEG42678.1 hypothetical protein PHALS_14649 [Plasmopara halstedii]|eukprot:XP_024579047.1 hypothetical protein PHALS_14649 [Plasmopara halstedii]
MCQLRRILVSFAHNCRHTFGISRTSNNLTYTVKVLDDVSADCSYHEIRDNWCFCGCNMAGISDEFVAAMP